MTRFAQYRGKVYRHAPGEASVWHQNGWRPVDGLPGGAADISERTANAKTGGRAMAPLETWDLPTTETVGAPVVVEVVVEPEAPDLSGLTKTQLAVLYAEVEGKAPPKSWTKAKIRAALEG